MLDRRQLLKMAGAAPAVAFGAESSPSVLTLLCDQLNASVTSTYGGPVPTPNLTRLAGRGMLFTQATCNTPFCSPTRTSIVTGQYPHTHGVVTNINANNHGLTGESPTMDKLLRAEGYAVHQYGKWHVSARPMPYYPDTYDSREYAAEMHEVFEKVRSRPRASWMEHYRCALPVTVAPEYRRAVEPLYKAKVNNPTWIDFVAKIGRLDLPLQQDFEVRVADRTVGRLRQVGTKPFSITCSFITPHDPNVVPSPYYEQFSPQEIRLPAAGVISIDRLLRTKGHLCAKCRQLNKLEGSVILTSSRNLSTTLRHLPA